MKQKRGETKEEREKVKKEEEIKIACQLVCPSKSKKPTVVFFSGIFLKYAGILPL